MCKGRRSLCLVVVVCGWCVCEKGVIPADHAPAHPGSCKTAGRCLQRAATSLLGKLGRCVVGEGVGGHAPYLACSQAQLHGTRESPKGQQRQLVWACNRRRRSPGFGRAGRTTSSERRRAQLWSVLAASEGSLRGGLPLGHLRPSHVLSG